MIDFILELIDRCLENLMSLRAVLESNFNIDPFMDISSKIDELRALRDFIVDPGNSDYLCRFWLIYSLVFL